MKIAGPTWAYRFILMLILWLSCSYVMILIPDTAAAQNPSDVKLAYDFPTKTLTVAITHNVFDPLTHYISKVIIMSERNVMKTHPTNDWNKENVTIVPVHQVQQTHTYKGQPDMNGVIYNYIVDAVPGDKIVVDIQCNHFGFATAFLTVLPPMRQSDIKVGMQATPVPTPVMVEIEEVVEEAAPSATFVSVPTVEVPVAVTATPMPVPKLTAEVPIVATSILTPASIEPHVVLEESAPAVSSVPVSAAEVPAVAGAAPKPVPERTEEGMKELATEIKRIKLRIQFDLDKAYVRPQYHDDIAALADILNKHPEMVIVIEGHTCSIGSEKYNMALSQARASNVRTYLIDKFGIDGSRIKVQSCGERKPIADNSTKEGRRLNRRAEEVTEYQVELTQ